MRSRGRPLFVALGLALLAAPRPSVAAPPDKQACVDAATRGQVYRDDYKLTSAAQAFQTCADAACPSAVRRECEQWLAEVRSRMPTVTVVVEGEAAQGARLRIDDGVAPLGTAHALDPGAHTVRLEAPGRTPIVIPVSLREREQRRLELPMPAPSPTAESSEPSRPVPLAVWILGGTSLLALSSFAFFGLGAKGETDRMLGECAPACPERDRDAAFRSAVVADVSLVVSLLAAGAAGYFFFTRPTVSVKSDGATLRAGGTFR